jgi:hypothetical protein
MFKLFKNAAKVVGAEYVVGKVFDLVAKKTSTKSKNKNSKTKAIKNIIKIYKDSKTINHETSLIIKDLEIKYQSIIDMQEAENQELMQCLNGLAKKIVFLFIICFAIQSFVFWIILNDFLNYYVLTKVPFL